MKNIKQRDRNCTKQFSRTLPKEMRKNFFDTVLSFMKMREQEVCIQADFAYENLKLVPTIENQSSQEDPEFAQKLYDIFLELPKPLQFGKENFKESIKDQKYNNQYT